MFSLLHYKLAFLLHLLESHNPPLLCFNILLVVMRFQGSKIGRMASWDVVGGAGVEDPGGHCESVYMVDTKPAIETARLRPGKKS